MLKKALSVALLLVLTTGCTSIDDDLSDCPTVDASQYQMNYQLRLVTNMTTELATELTTTAEVDVANALQVHLKDIFSDFAHDVDLSFYDTEGTLERLQHDQHIMDANQTSYTLTLPMRKYLHLAVANIADNDVVSLTDDAVSNTSTLRQAEGSLTDSNDARIVDSHTTGLFTARQPMQVLEGIDQTFNVRLYMANSAVSLVINPKGHKFKDLTVYSTGFAEAFHISDSTYVYPESAPLIKAEKLPTDNDLLCYCSVNFPSRDAAVSLAPRRVAASAPKQAPSDPTLWQFKVYATQTDGSITETVLNIDTPLKAGELRIIKGELDDDCAVRPYDSKVGVSITLEWESGVSKDVPL